MKETDWRIERLFRAVALFDEIQVLEEAILRLKKHNWLVYEFNCEDYDSQEAFLNAILHRMGLMDLDYVYKNIRMIQFWDLFRNTQEPEESGVALVFKYFHAFEPQYPEFFQELLGVMAREHYYQLRHGSRFMACVHLADRSVKFEPIFTIQASWNEQSSFNEEADSKWEEIRRNLAALSEAKKWLNEHGYPELRSRTLNKALQQVTGATDSSTLLQMNLDALEIVRLLQEFDYGSLNVD